MVVNSAPARPQGESNCRVQSITACRLKEVLTSGPYPQYTFFSGHGIGWTSADGRQTRARGVG